MKFSFLLFFIFSLNFHSFEKSVYDFDNELSEIVENFTKDIMNKDECENHKNEAEDLAEEIQKALDSENDYTLDEKIKLKKIKKEAEAIEDFIGTIADCGNYMLKIDNLVTASNRIDFEIYSISSKYCVEIITIQINNYIVYLVKNTSKINYSISYNWKTQNGLTKANGKMGMLKETIRNIYNNREKPNQKTIIINSINCISI